MTVIEKSNQNLVSKLESLILSSEDFLKLEGLSDRFCPFEATGMIRQEIKHSHFLSYILDANRPHEFGNKFLKELLYLVSDGGNQTSAYTKLDFHFLEVSNLRVLREWRDIDILIEIETAEKQKGGLVIAIENKIDAAEHGDQLTKYKKIIDADYPETDWDREFVFLTIDGSPPSAKHALTWQPLSLEELITAFERAIEKNGFNGPSTKSFRAYATMLRRHILSNDELETLARRIWAQHREALQTLINYEPNLCSDIQQELNERHEEIADEFSKASKMEIVPEFSDRAHLRFAVKDWDDFPSLNKGDNNWVSSDRILIIELTRHRNKNFKISMVIGPGEPEVRESIYQAVLKQPNLQIGRKTKTANAKWKHLSSSIVLKREKVMSFEDKGMDPSDLVNKIVENCVKYIRRDLPTYHEIVETLFSGI